VAVQDKEPEMKVRVAFLMMLVLLAGAVFAGGAPVLEKVFGPIVTGEKKPCEVRKIKNDRGIFVEVYDPAGKKFWTSESLGVEDKKFMLVDKMLGLALKDLDKDGVDEILVSAFIGPQSSGLYVFKYNAKTRGFDAMKSRFPKEDLDRDCLISDVNQESGGDLVVNPDGSAVVLGMIYAENAEEPPVPGLYSFLLKDGVFVHQKTEKLPPPPKE